MYKVEKRTAVGSIRGPEVGTWTNVPLVAVMVNGITVATFLRESEADTYIEARWPDRHGKQHDGRHDGR